MAKKFPVRDFSLANVCRLLKKHPSTKLWGRFSYKKEYRGKAMTVINDLEKRKLLEIKDSRFYLTIKGKKLVGDLIKEEKSVKMVTKKGVIKFPIRYRRILPEIKKVLSEFKPDLRYDQAPITAESAIAEVFCMDQRGDISGKSVVCVGDDDFVSIILAITGKPKEVLAVDIDSRVLNLIKKHTKKLKVPVTTLKHDFRKPIPKKYRNRYDTFRSWPPDVALSSSLFVSRAIELLKKEKGCGYFGITFLELHPLELLELRGNFKRMGIQIAEYLEQALICYYKNIKFYTDIAILKTTKSSRPIFKTFKGKLPLSPE